jgi:nitrate/nitrite-specific signal transduction histidine kinase
MGVNKISSKIKISGALLIITTFTVIFATIYLNQQISKDASIINMAGKQRMLTQMISKNVFYINNTQKLDFKELDAALTLFSDNLYKLTHGDYNKGIYVVSNDKINIQLLKVTKMWNSFASDIQVFKHNIQTKNFNTSYQVNKIFSSNGILLKEIDKLVGMYATYSEYKNTNIITFQYYATLILVLIMIYGLRELRKIEIKVNEFLDYSKKLATSDDLTNIKEVDTQETELVEANSTLNCFLNKLNSAVEESNNALEHSHNASVKLEEINEQFADVLDQLENNAISEDAIDRSEDIIIESSEELQQSTKKLQYLKKELDTLLNSCK